MSTRKTLTDLLSEGSINKSTPYTNAYVKVVIIKVGHTATFPPDGQILNFSIGDETATMPATLNDKDKQYLIREGKTVHVRNFILKNGKLIMTPYTRIMATTALLLPQDILAKGVSLILPASPKKAIKDIKDCKIKDVVTVEGQVVKNEVIQTVKVGILQQDTLIKTISIKDQSDVIEVTLWRELAEREIPVGKYLRVTRCIIGEWQNRMTLSTTRSTEIEEIEAPEMTISGIIEGISIHDKSVEIAVAVAGTILDYNIDKTLLISALDIVIIEEASNQEIEEKIVQMLPIAVYLKVRGADVMDISKE